MRHLLPGLTEAPDRLADIDRAVVRIKPMLTALWIISLDPFSKITLTLTDTNINVAKIKVTW